jgi:tRNA dimethylallyltransferase
VSAGITGPADTLVPIAVVGPTATGKSDLGLDLAEALGGEIVNIDAMQQYRGMDIGTAKLSPTERRGVPHHLLDIWDVTHPADVASYRDAARAAVADIQARGKLALLVGGSGLYVRAVLDELDFPGTDPVLRAQLEAELAAAGPFVLHARLRERDPQAAAAILPSNGRRIVRALEVVALTGSFTARLPPGGYAEDVAGAGVVQLGVDRTDLDARIEVRCERMWTAGLVDEVRRLEGAGLREGRTASRALGYRQVLAYLDGELADEAAALAETVRATRRFVRRQRSWFRRDDRIAWLDPDDAADPTDRAEALIAAAAHR